MILKLIWPLLLFLPIWAVPAFAKGGLTLDDVLRQSRGQAPEYAEYQAQEEAALAKAAGVDGAFDSSLYLNSQVFEDRSEQTSAFAGRARQGESHTIGTRKLFSSGTSYDLSLTFDRNRTEFPPPEPPTIDPLTGQAQGGSDASQFTSYNPSHTAQAQLKISQSLWRNFAAAEVELQKQLAASAALPPRFQKVIVSQGVQYQAEQLYWSMLRLREQIALMRSLVDKSKRFRTLMRKRTELGRADQVDVASSEAQVVAYEGQLLDLEIAYRDAARRLGRLIYPKGGGAEVDVSGSLEENPTGLVVKDRATAFTTAKRSRLDLQLLRAQRSTITIERRLADEQDKPSLDIFGSAATTGLDQTGEDAVDKAGKLEHPTWAVGLELTWNLGGTTAEGDRLAAASKDAELNAREQRILADIQADIDLAFQQHEAAAQQERQAERSVGTLDRQLAAERRRFRQARTEEIGVVRYELEWLSAKTALINAHYNARIAESQIRFLLHNYPTNRQPVARK